MASSIQKYMSPMIPDFHLSACGGRSARLLHKQLMVSGLTGSLVLLIERTIARI